jgi:Tol biopolymer transport system component/sugar lactone lactonase YvrE
MGAYRIFYNRIKIKIIACSLFAVFGLIFVIPETIPEAEAAHNANLIVSAENTMFTNHFAGPQVIEVVVSDPAISSTISVQAEPDVTVNGKDLRMVQATDGNWYGYFADRTQSQLADATQLAASGKGLDFGEFCNTSSDLGDQTGISSVLFTDTVGVAIASEATVGGVQGTTPITPSTACLPGSIGPFNTMHVVRQSQTPTPEGGTVDTGQIGIDLDAWPFIQLYDFAVDGNVDIIYNKGGLVQTVSLTFTSSTPSLVPDRALLTPASQVVFTLTDNQLNIDPTDKDSWTWATTPFGEQMFYQLFDSNGVLDADGTAGAVDLLPSIPTFNWSHDGQLTLDVGTTFNLADNAIHEITVPGDISTAATVGGSIPAGSQPVTFLENDMTSGTFENTGMSGTNFANIIVSPGTTLGSFALIDYSPTPTIFTVIDYPLSMVNGRITDILGNPVYFVTENEQVVITADVSNNSGSSQPFAFLAQVLDEFGATVAFSWISGNLNDGQSFSPALSWSTASAGTYTVKMYLWQALDDPFALAAPISFEQDVFGNGQIVFSSDRDGPAINNEIYTMNSDGTIQTRRTNNAAQFDSAPSWSPDGTMIVFQSNLDGDFEVYTMNADGTGLTQLTNNIASNDISPSWSPDGSQIVFATNRDGNFEIYIMNADGTVQTNRSNDPANDISPSWSPNGVTIAFSSNRAGSGHDIYGMNADGTGVVNISSTPGSDDFDPQWSPDGTQIVFETQRDANFEIYTMSSTGASQTNISNSPTSIDQYPSWSPDGLHIAFTTNRDGNTEVYIMDADGTAPLNRSNNPSTADGHPDWGIAPNTPSNIELDTEEYEVNTEGFITVTDSAANLNSAVVDTVLVQMSSTADLTGFAVTTTETDVNTGIFISPQIKFSSAATDPSQNILHAPAGSTVFANYNPTDSALIVCNGCGAAPLAVPAVRFDSELYVHQSSGELRIDDSTRAGQVQFTVNVKSDATPAGIPITMVEDALNSGKFVSSPLITFTRTQSSTPHFLLVNNLDTIRLTAPYSVSGTPYDPTASIVPPFDPPLPIGIVDDPSALSCDTDIDSNGNYDNDNDGICDNWENQAAHAGLEIEYQSVIYQYVENDGITCKPLINDPAASAADDAAYGTLDDTPFCPNPNKKDIFVEIDYMTGHKPDASALRKVVEAFATAPSTVNPTGVGPGINLHILVDENIGFHQVNLPENAAMSAANPQGGFVQIKQSRFMTESARAGEFGGLDDTRTAIRQVWHYVLFMHNDADNPGSSGLGEIGGNDLGVSLGGFDNFVGSPDQQAGTLMHELGHNLNLRHGGNVDEPVCKPNYISVLGYAFQMPNIISDRALDFSRSAIPVMTEGALSEPAGFARTTPPGLKTVFGGVDAQNVALPRVVASTNDATMALTVDGTIVYITDPGNNRFHKITAAAASFTPTERRSEPSTDLSPEGIAIGTVSSTKFIFIADTGNHRIQKINAATFATSATQGSLGSGSSNYNSPEGLAVSGLFLYVADKDNNRIKRVGTSALGSPLIIGSAGSGNGQFKTPWAVAADATTLFVADTGNHRIQKFTLANPCPAGTTQVVAGVCYAAQIGSYGSGPGQFIFPRGIALAGGYIFVADTGNHRIQKIDATTLATPALSNIFGSYGTTNGKFDSPEGIAVDSTGNIYVADTGNKRVQKFDSAFIFKYRYLPTSSNAFSISTPVAVNYNRDTDSTDTPPTGVSQPIHVLGIQSCTPTAGGTSPVDIFGYNDWANLDLIFRDDNVLFSDGFIRFAQNELTSQSNDLLLSSNILAIDELLFSFNPDVDFPQPPEPSLSAQNAIHTDLLAANNLIIAGDLEAAIPILDVNVRVGILGLPLVPDNPDAFDAEDIRVQLLVLLENAIAALNSATQDAAVSQIFADDDSATTSGPPVDIAVLANDGDESGGTITIVSFMQGMKGVVSDNGDGTLKYTPNAGASGGDSFTYTISNQAGQTDSATVTIDIILAPRFDLKWGTFGSSNGQFKSPIGIDVDSSGKVYVTDSGNNRIQKFSSSGSFDRKWGSSGTGNGQFKNPSSLHIDSAGKVYVTDSGNNRIQKFSSSGSFDRKWGSYGTGDGKFKNPTGIGIDLATNKVYVGDSDNHRVQKFTSTGSFELKWGSFGTSDNQFKRPRGVAVDSAGNVYVADSINHKIKKFSSAGVFILQWGSFGTGDGQFKNPTGVDVDSAGNVYVVDTDNHRIQKFTSTGMFIVKWGTFGSGDGQFKSPIGIAVDSAGNVYIGDTGNHRVQKFVP